MIIYHGSTEIIERPIWGAGKAYNDYGRGFYCTEQLELAKEWACTEGVNGYANQYEINTDGLNILNLFFDEYTILHWLTLLITYRGLRLSTPIMRRGAEWLQEHFLIDIGQYDVIVGYRADDSYFSFARAFVGNEISLQQLGYAMRLGKLGEQFVLKSKKAFEQLHFIAYIEAEHEIYYEKRKIRDHAARKAYVSEQEKDDLDGIYMRDIIREEMRADDTRLR